MLAVHPEEFVRAADERPRLLRAVTRRQGVRDMARPPCRRPPQGACVCFCLRWHEMCSHDVGNNTEGTFEHLEYSSFGQLRRAWSRLYTSSARDR